MKTASAAAIATLLLAACQTLPEGPARATAQLQPTKGSKTFGEATFEEVGGKVRVVVFVQGLKPGQEHGLHIQEVGDCSSGDGMSTKGHFNPFNKPHGAHTSAERHAGDLREANRKFKPPFSLSATLSPARQAGNRTVFCENVPRSMIVRAPHGAEAAHFDAV